MASKLNDTILDALSTNGELTLNELYAVIEENDDFDWENSVRKHRIRSALYNLQQHNKVVRSSPRTYKLI